MKYIAKYTVVFEASNPNMAELISIDLEGAIQGVDRKIQAVYVDPYLEEVDD